METRFFKGATEDSKKIRTDVFIHEQGFKSEFDNYDEYVDTVVIYDVNTPVATGRVFLMDEKSKTYKIGRIAVIKERRGEGLGSIVVKELENKAKTLGAKKIVVLAQVKAMHFYNTCGYKEFGEKCMDEHVEHIYMEKQLN